MSDFIIGNLRGGLNNSDPPTSLPDDQVVTATNTEVVTSTLGERRRGASAISTTGSDLVGHTDCPWMFRHLPTTDPADAQLWALGTTGTSSSHLCYKDTSWHTVTPDDAITLSEKYHVQGLTLHGKLFVAYKSSKDRLHVWDGTDLRVTGLSAPAAAPTGADEGSGTFSGTRYYRVRYTRQSSGTTILRSEPSDALTKAPSGSGAGITVTRPALINEGETHWELEASVDNATFYRIATTAVATTTVNDETVFSPGYADLATAVLSDAIGSYGTIPSGKFLIADRDRVMVLGSWEDDALSSRVSWTPVYNTPDFVGNDERLDSTVDPSVDLDTYEGGPITGAANGTGSIYVFKQHHVYKLTASGIVTRAYDVTPLSKIRGAVEGSIVEAVDQDGNPAVYFFDPQVGPCRITIGGAISRCGADIRVTTDTINLDASVVCRSFYYPKAQQVHWFIATNSSDVPDTRIVLHVNHTRVTDDGVRKGWAIWDGPSAAALTATLYADNIDAGVARSNTLVPFIGVADSSLIWETDTGTTDHNTAYAATIKTRPYIQRNILNEFGVQNAALIGKAVTGAVIDVDIVRDFGLETNAVTNVTFDPTGSEDRVIKVLDNLEMSSAKVVQLTFKDTASPGSRWELDAFAMKQRTERTP